MLRRAVGLPGRIAALGCLVIPVLPAGAQDYLIVNPSVPAIAESGAPKFDVNAWWGILAPAGTGLRIVRKISADVADVEKWAKAVKASGARID